MSEIKLRDRSYNGRMVECSINEVLDKGYVGVGWNSILSGLINELIENGWNGTIIQIKEKFGGLRFYVETANEKLYSIIWKYEDLSLRTCEFCGAPGSTRGPQDKRYWIKVNCDKCHEEWTEKNKLRLLA